MNTSRTTHKREIIAILLATIYKFIELRIDFLEDKKKKSLRKTNIESGVNSQKFH